MLKLIIPTIENVLYSKVFSIIEKKAAMSDVAIATGGSVSENYHIKGDNSLKGRVGSYWIKDRYDYRCANLVGISGHICYDPVTERGNSVRPALEFSSIDDLMNVVSGELEYFQGIIRGKLYVPLYVAEQETHNNLFKLLNYRELEPLKLSIVTFPTEYKSYYRRICEPFTQKNNCYYKYEGKLYLLLDVHSCYGVAPVQYTNGEYYKEGDQIFAEVNEEYVYFDLAERTKDGNYLAYFDKIPFAGVSFDHAGYYPDNFEKSDIGQYLRVYLQELVKLQSVVRRIKGKSQRDLETNAKNNVPTAMDQSGEAQTIVRDFIQLCSKSNSLNLQIKKLEEQLKKAGKDKQTMDEEIELFKRLMTNGGTNDGRL